jgi:hypothetical protein
VTVGKYPQCPTGCHALRQEYRLKSFENEVLRRIGDEKRKELEDGENYV